MKLSSQYTTIWISPTNIIVGHIVIDEALEMETLGEYEWTDDNLTDIFKEIQTQLKPPVRILLDDRLVYMTTIEIQSKSTPLREIVQKEVQKIIPEDLSQTAWDFEEITLDDEKNKKKKSEIKKIQVAATVQSFNDIFMQAVQESGLEINVIEPMSVVLATLNDTDKSPYLIYVDNDDSVMITACFKGKSYISEAFTTNPKPEDVENFIKYVEEVYSIKPEKVITIEKKTTGDRIFKKLKLKVKLIEHDPMALLALMNDFKGSDEDVMNLEPNSTFRRPKISKANSKLEMIRLILGLIIISIIAILIYHLLTS